jgi:hypothetical protein
MAFEFIFLLLFGTLALCRVDHHSRIRENDKSQPKQKKHGNCNAHRHTEITVSKKPLFLFTS